MATSHSHNTPKRITLMELDDELYEKITSLSEQGEAFIDEERYQDAIALFEKALNLVPKPKRDWEAATWLNAALGDAYYLLEEFETASDYLYDALNCPNGMGNPFIHLRLGECLFQLGRMRQAEENLLSAYMMEGEEIFSDEPPEYLAVVKRLEERSQSTSPPVPRVCEPQASPADSDQPNQPLEQKLKEEILTTINTAYDLEVTGDYAGALSTYLEAWHMLPEPRTQWDDSLVPARSLVEFFYDRKRYDDAKEWVDVCLHCYIPPIGVSTHILAGKVYLDSGDEETAAEYFREAYRRGKRRAFAEEDPKYLEFTLGHLK